MIAPILMVLVTLGCISFGQSKDAAVKPSVTTTTIAPRTVTLPDGEVIPDPHDNPLCLDKNGKFDADLGTDDLDCGNF